MKDFAYRCELKLLICEPNPLRPDRVTIGFVLRDLNPEAPRVEVRFAKSLQAVRCIYPDADIEAIQGTLKNMQSVLENVTDIERYLQNLPADFPADFALLSKGAVLTDSIDAEVAVLEEQYLKRLVAHDFGAPEFGSRYLREHIKDYFAADGVLGLLAKDIPVAKYTFKNDPLKIDFGYPSKQDASYRFIHAISVVRDVEQARILALSWPSVKTGFETELERQCEMLAIIEQSKYHHTDTAQAAMLWMQDVGIRVEPVSSMKDIAREAKTALKA